MSHELQFYIDGATRAHKLSIKSAARKRGFTLEHENAKGDSKNIKKLLGI